MITVNGVMAAIAAVLIVVLVTVLLPPHPRKTDKELCRAYTDWSVRKNVKMPDMERQCRRTAWWQR